MRIVDNIILIILNYRRSIETIECIKSIESSTIRPRKIIVVDNDSGDDSVEKIREKYPNLYIYQTGLNLGYTGGMNEGIRIALEEHSTHIVITNSDVIFYTDTVELLYEALVNNVNAAIATPSIYYSQEKNRLWYGGGKLNYLRSSGFSNKSDNVNIQNDKITLVDFVSGCSFMIKTSVLRQLHGFDNRYFMYQEDVDLSARIVKENYSMLYVPRARVDHNVNEGYIKPLSLYYSMRNRLLFIKLHLHGITKYLAYFYMYITITMKFFFWMLHKPSLSKALIYSVKDFMKSKFNKNSHINLMNCLCLFICLSTTISSTVW